MLNNKDYFSAVGPPSPILFWDKDDQPLVSKGEQREFSILRVELNETGIFNFTFVI